MFHFSEHKPILPTVWLCVRRHCAGARKRYLYCSQRRGSYRNRWQCGIAAKAAKSSSCRKINAGCVFLALPRTTNQKYLTEQTLTSFYH